VQIGRASRSLEYIRWNIKVSKNTDLTLRTFLGSQGMKKGNLSKFIKDAVRWHVVLDTNILVSAMIASAGNPAAIVNAWLGGKFTLPTCAEHVDKLRATLQKPRVAKLIKPRKAGRLVNQIKELAWDVGEFPDVERSTDPTDDFLLATSEAGQADYVVTGDKDILLDWRCGGWHSVVQHRPQYLLNSVGASILRAIVFSIIVAIRTRAAGALA
jgi:putative PIN family toxin of toxin-antitoxin system